MLSGAPARACPVPIPHGGILAPLSSSSAASMLHPSGALRPCRSRGACDLALQFRGSRSAHTERRQSARQLGTVRGHERQPGPQEDGCGFSGLEPSGGHHNLQPQPQPQADPQHPLGSPSADASLQLPVTVELPGSAGVAPLRVSEQPGPDPRQEPPPTPTEHLSGGTGGGGAAAATAAVATATNSEASQSGPDDTSLARRGEGDGEDGGPRQATEQPGGTPTTSSFNSSSGGLAGSGLWTGSGGSPHSAHQQPGVPVSGLSGQIHKHQQQGGQEEAKVEGDTETPLEQHRRAPPEEGGSPPQQPQQQQPLSSPGGGLRGAGREQLGPTPGLPAGSAGAPGGGPQLPPLRLDFLDWSKLQGGGAGGGSGLSQMGSSSRAPLRGGAAGGGAAGGGAAGGGGGAVRRRRASGAVLSDGRSRSDRILQLVLAAKTLLHVRAVISRHLPYMSVGTAALALSRLAGLSIATMRLRRAQLQHQQQQQSQQTAPRQNPPPQRQQLQEAEEQQPQQAPLAATEAVAASPGGTGDGVAAAVPWVGGLAAGGGAGAAAAAAGVSPVVEASGAALGTAPGGTPGASLPPLPPAGTLRVGLTPRAVAAIHKQQQRQQQQQQQEQQLLGPGRAVVPAAGGAPAGKAGDGDGEEEGDGALGSDPSARVQPGSLRLMRLLLRHIAMGLETDTAAGPRGAAARWRSGPTPPPPPTPSSAPPSASSSSSADPRVNGPRGSGSAPSRSAASSRPASSSSSSSSWRFQPPEHRARVAGTVLMTLARVGLKPSPADVWALYRLVEAARPDLFLASPQQLSRLASSLPLLPPLRPSGTWLDHFASVARSKMYAADAGQLAAYSWCLARLGHNPGDLWLHSLTHHLARDDLLSAASPGALCQVLWALHRLDFTPDPDWREDCRRAVQRALTATPLHATTAATATSASAADEQLPSAPTSPRSPSSPSWGGSSRRYASAARHSAAGTSAAAAAGQAGRRRGPRSYDKMDERDSDDDLYDSSSSVDELEPDLEAVDPRANGGGGAAARRYGSGHADVASLLLWAVRMGMAPPPAGIQACLDRLQPHLRSLRRVHLLRLLLALSECGHRPSEAFMARLLGCLQPKLPLLGPTQLTQMLLAISRLRFVPPQPWLVAFLKTSRVQLHHYTPAHVTATYQVFAGWQLRPSRPYLQALHSLLDGLMPECPPQGLATVLQSMSALGIKPQRRWVARALEVLVEGAARGASGTAPLTHGSASGLDTVTSVSSTTAFPSLSPSTGGGGGFGSVASLGSQASAPGGGGAGQQHQTLRQQQRAGAAAALVAAACSLRGIVQLDGPERASSRTTPAAAAAPTAGSAAVGAAPSGDSSRGGNDTAGTGTTAAAAVVGVAVGMDGEAQSATLLPYELWSATKQLTDLCGQLLDVMSGAELARLLTALARVNFYPGRAFLAAHARATARVGAQLVPADKEALADCYSRLAALAPAMAEEARRQAEARQARTAVMVADPWVN